MRTCPQLQHWAQGLPCNAPDSSLFSLPPSRNKWSFLPTPPPCWGYPGPQSPLVPLIFLLPTPAPFQTLAVSSPLHRQPKRSFSVAGLEVTLSSPQQEAWFAGHLSWDGGCRRNQPGDQQKALGAPHSRHPEYDPNVQHALPKASSQLYPTAQHTGKPRAPARRELQVTNDRCSFPATPRNHQESSRKYSLWPY